MSEDHIDVAEVSDDDTDEQSMPEGEIDSLSGDDTDDERAPSPDPGLVMRPFTDDEALEMSNHTFKNLPARSASAMTRKQRGGSVLMSATSAAVDENCADIQLQGILLKQSSAGSKRWGARYFALNGTVLSYYHAEKDYQAVKSGKGKDNGTHIPVDKFILTIGESTKKEFAFQLYHPTERSWILAADNAENMTRWTDALRKASFSSGVAQIRVPGRRLLFSVLEDKRPKFPTNRLMVATPSFLYSLIPSDPKTSSKPWSVYLCAACSGVSPMPEIVGKEKALSLHLSYDKDVCTTTTPEILQCEETRTIHEWISCISDLSKQESKAMLDTHGHIRAMQLDNVPSIPYTLRVTGCGGIETVQIPPWREKFVIPIYSDVEPTNAFKPETYVGQPFARTSGLILDAKSADCKLWYRTIENMPNKSNIRVYSAMVKIFKSQYVVSYTYDHLVYLLAKLNEKFPAYTFPVLPPRRSETNGPLPSNGIEDSYAEPDLYNNGWMDALWCELLSNAEIAQSTIVLDMLDLQEPYRAVNENDCMLLETIHKKFFVSLDDVYPSGDSLCHIAMVNNNLPIITYLMENVVMRKRDDVALANIRRKSTLDAPIHLVMIAGVPAAVDLLLAKGGDLTLRNIQDETPLHVAVRNNHVDIAKLLIDKGASCLAKDKRGWTPLMVAAKQGYCEMIKVLVPYTDTSIGDTAENRTALHLACMAGRTDVVQVLLSAGCDGNVRDVYDNTSLHLAAEFGHVACVDLLLTSGVGILASNKKEQTPLLVAACRPRGRPEVELTNKEYLLANDIPTTLPEEVVAPPEVSGWVCLDSAYQTLTSIAKAGKKLVSLNKTTPDGASICHLGVTSGNHAVLVFGLLNDIDLNLQDNMGRTALHLAVAKNNVLAVQLLLLLGRSKINVALQDKTGSSALHLAILNMVEKDTQASVNDIAVIMLGYHHFYVSPEMISQAPQLVKGKSSKALTESVEEKPKYATPKQIADGERIIKALVASGHPMDIANQDGECALDLALSVGAKTAVLALAQCGADPNTYNMNTGYTCLQSAIRTGLACRVQYLSFFGQTLELTKLDGRGETSLGLACQTVCKDLVILPEATVVELTSQAKKSGGSLDASLVAPHANCLGLVATLLDMGLDVNIKSMKTETALFQAVVRKDTLAYKFLIAYGADSDLANVLKETPLSMATKTKQKDLVDLLQVTRQCLKCKKKATYSRMEVVATCPNAKCGDKVQVRDGPVTCPAARGLNAVADKLLAREEEAKIEAQPTGPSRPASVALAQQTPSRPSSAAPPPAAVPVSELVLTNEVSTEVSRDLCSGCSIVEREDMFALDTPLVRLGTCEYYVVYKGQYKGKQCAIRIIPGDKPQLKADLIAAADFKKPHVMPMTAMFFGPTRTVIATELSPAGSLQTLLLDKSVNIDWKTRIDVLLTVAKCLSFMHRASPPRVHGHVKASNILIFPGYAAKLAEYGLQSLKIIPCDVAHAAHMAPEYLQLKQVDEEGDVYSFAVLMYEVLTRAVPFDGVRTVADLVRRVCNENERPQLHTQTTAPDGYVALMNKCWQMDRPSIGDVVEELEAIAEQVCQEHMHVCDWFGDVCAALVPNNSTTTDYADIIANKVESNPAPVENEANVVPDLDSQSEVNARPPISSPRSQQTSVVEELPQAVAQPQQEQQEEEESNAAPPMNTDFILSLPGLGDVDEETNPRPN